MTTAEVLQTQELGRSTQTNSVASKTEDIACERHPLRSMVCDCNVKGAQILELKGRIDAGNAQAFETLLNQIVNAGDGAVVVNLSGVDYISSAWLRVMFITLKKLTADNRAMALAEPNPDVKDVMRLTGFDEILPCYCNLDKAVHAVTIH